MEIRRGSEMDANMKLNIGELHVIQQTYNNLIARDDLCIALIILNEIYR